MRKNVILENIIWKNVISENVIWKNNALVLKQGYLKKQPRPMKKGSYVPG